MAVLKVKESGVWKSPDKMHAKVAGAWVPAKKAWMKINSSWVKIYPGLPKNLIVMYDTADHVPTSATRLFEFQGVYPMGKDSYGSTGGTMKHDSTLHGVSTASITDDVGGGTYIGDPPLVSRHTMHNHSFAHTHGGSATHTPLSIDFVPTIGGDFIGANSLWLTAESSLSDLFDAYSAALGRYIRFNIAYSLTGSESHSHTITGSTSTMQPTAAINRRWQIASGAYSFATPNHTHSMNHSHTVANNQPYVVLGAYKLNMSIDFEALPSGTIAFFNSNVLPEGWSRYSVADNRHIKCGDTSRGSTGGVSTHSHPVESFNTGAPSATGPTSNEGGYLGSAGHTHIMDHGHTTAVDWTLAYVGIVIGVKA